MFIKNNNFFIIIFLGILLIYFFNLFKEQFKIIICPTGQIESSDGTCKCPLIGQVYDKKKEKCKCDIGKKETIINNKTICM
jgi:hypothetical protein